MAQELTRQAGEAAITELAEVLKAIIANPVAAGTTATILNRLLYQRGFYEPRKMWWRDFYPDASPTATYLQYGYKDYETVFGVDMPEWMKGLPIPSTIESRWSQITSSFKPDEMSDLERINYQGWLKVQNFILLTMALWGASGSIQSAGSLLKLLPASK